MKCSIDGRKVENRAENGYVTLIEEWHGQKITFDISFAIEAVRLKGSELYAFREGPILLAGLTDKEVTIHSGQIRPDELLVPFAEREWGFWRNSFITKGQKENIVFKYLYEICEEQYTVYFPVI